MSCRTLLLAFVSVVVALNAAARAGTPSEAAPSDVLVHEGTSMALSLLLHVHHPTPHELYDTGTRVPRSDERCMASRRQCRLSARSKSGCASRPSRMALPRP